MRYNGGKARVGKKFADVINGLNPSVYIEPFLGAASVMVHVESPLRIGYDINGPLISLWRSVKNGWNPPTSISEEEYKIARTGGYPDNLTAFIAFGCSWGGKWFGGYARDSSGSNYCSISRRSILKKIKALKNVIFEESDYKDIVPIPGSVIYCDPPYSDTTEAWGSYGSFDFDEFCETVRGWSKTSTVLVSMYKCPRDFVCVLDLDDPVISGSYAKSPEKIQRTEKLFMV
jgi:DNA adenine methylase